MQSTFYQVAAIIFPDSRKGTRRHVINTIVNNLFLTAVIILTFIKFDATMRTTLPMIPIEFDC